MSDYKPTRKMNDDDDDYPYPPPANPGTSYPSAKTQVLRRKNEPLALAWLVIVNGTYQGQMSRLEPGSTVAGRDPGCQIILDDPAASRQHIKIRGEKRDDKQYHFILHDLASENGTLLNGEEVLKSDLTDGDYITIGQTDIVFKQVLPRKKKVKED